MPIMSIRLSAYDKFLTRIYFLFKPALPARIKLLLRRVDAAQKRAAYRNIWPIDEKAKFSPPNWKGWPDGKKFALVLTHDVETEIGQHRCNELADLEERLGFKSAFNFIGREYNFSLNTQGQLLQKGFEIGLHGIIHNGNPFESRVKFEKQAIEMNKYLKDWTVTGFRCPSMYHNLEWIGELNIEYDSSTFDTDPFEPQPDGVRTIFPFRVGRGNGNRGYVELPYTLPQDHTLFVVMQEENIDIWKRKLDWITENGGMALLITHPDYMNFNRKKAGISEYPVAFYEEFLGYVKTRYAEQYWNALPKDIVRFWEVFENNHGNISSFSSDFCLGG